MNSKEEILENNELGDLYSIASALGWDFDNFKKCVHGALGEYAKQEAIGFSNWKDMYMNDPPVGELASNENLYELYLKSKEGV